MSFKLKNKKLEKGQLLLEILVAISVLAVVGLLSAQLLLINMQSSKISTEKNTALGLFKETSEAIEAVVMERWENLFGLSKGNVYYYPEKSNDKWVFSQGQEEIEINDIIYKRFFTVQNICRDQSTKEIKGITDENGTATTCVNNGGAFDPSTQKINIQITWSNNEPLVVSKYITRWPNNICVQTSWLTSGSNGVKTCPDTTFESATNLTTGNSLQIQQ